MISRNRRAAKRGARIISWVTVRAPQVPDYIIMAGPYGWGKPQYDVMEGIDRQTRCTEENEIVTLDFLDIFYG